MCHLISDTRRVAFFMSISVRCLSNFARRSGIKSHKDHVEERLDERVKHRTFTQKTILLLYEIKSWFLHNHLSGLKIKEHPTFTHWFVNCFEASSFTCWPFWPAYCFFSYEQTVHPPRVHLQPGNWTDQLTITLYPRYGTSSYICL